MSRESLEELRQRLLGQHNVQQMIQVRAYEIYRMRGSQPGGEAQDWFHAENEVLAFLLADESSREDERAVSDSQATAATEPSSEAPAGKKPRSRASGKSGDGKMAGPKKTAKRTTAKKSAEPKSKSRSSRKAKEEGQDR